MITVNNVSNRLVSPVREIRARVELYEGSTLIETCNCHDRLIKFDIQRIGDTSKFFGFGICQRLNFHLIDKNRTLNITTAHSIKVSYSFDNVNFIYPYPTFYVTEVNRDENTNELSVTAYDRLNLLDMHTVSEIPLKMPYGMHMYAIEIAAILGLNNVMLVNVPDEMIFYNELPIAPNFEGNETFRDALDDIAEATQTIYYVDVNNFLVFKRLKVDEAADLEITREDYITLESKTNRRLSAICRATELGDNVTASLEVSGTTQFLRDNAFLDNRDDIADVLNKALREVGGFTINQFTCSWRGNFLLEIGDKIGMVTKNNGMAYSYVLDDIISYDGSLREVTTWTYTADAAETASNPVTIGEKIQQTFAKVDKVNQRVELVAGEMSSIVLDNESIKQSVIQMDAEMETVLAELQTKMTAEELSIAITQALQNVDSITTTTGYTFDSDGLEISRTDSSIKTVISEDGMTIYRSGAEILVADNLGVKAEDLQASTFLVIGDNSRFENYKNTRTACYYLR